MSLSKIIHHSHIDCYLLEESMFVNYKQSLVAIDDCYLLEIRGSPGEKEDIDEFLPNNCA